MAKRSVQAQLDDFFYVELIKYLKLAEEKRRWNVFKDIPWDRANPDTEDTLAHCVETFCAVEMYLPDFTSKMLHMIRRSRGRSWFHVNWGYEESKHSLALEAWLLASGHRTEEQRESFERELLEAEWELPFDHPRQMVCYTMIQELATFWNYRNLEKMAAQQKDLALVSALRVISVDERVHYNFYRNLVKQWMKLDEAGTVEDLKYVFDHFTMPGKSQIPRYDESARILAKTGIYGPREYIKLVKNPVLEDLQLDKDFNKMETAQAREKEEKAAREEQLKREQIAVGNGHAVPKNGSPLNGKPAVAGTKFNSHAVNEVLSNNKPHAPRSGDFVQNDSEDSESRPSPFLQLIGIEPKQRTPSSSVIMAWEAEQEKLPGSRGMDKYDALDQKLMVIGDEISNNAEEMRQERQKIRRNRVKNNKLFRDSE
ncbi:MAG: acyl-[acyl-carrier-protein] desaturase [Abditibacteriota bacterium]|nr:acyl-[acyl-carrier-protein] desaturase [Abditibacteriota bacterium]